jgi:hypothetical protein
MENLVKIQRNSSHVRTVNVLFAKIVLMKKYIEKCVNLVLNPYARNVPKRMRKHVENAKCFSVENVRSFQLMDLLMNRVDIFALIVRNEK